MNNHNLVDGFDLTMMRDGLRGSELRNLIEIFGFQSICSKCDEILRFDDRRNRPPHHIQ